MKFFVTTPIYYVNARPHVGHAYATVAADVVARWQRKRSRDVLFSTGVDENSQKNVEAAEKQGKEVQTYVDEMAKIWQDTFKQLGFSHDVFVRTTSPEHVQAVHAILKKIDEQGDMYLGDYEGLYCVDCEEFKAEKDLVDGLCPIHKTKPKKIKEKNYFFRLSKYRDQLLKRYADHPDFVQPESARNKILSYIEHEMEDVSLSRQSQKWGIQMPQDKDHVVYVWFDALISYLTVTGYPWEENETSLAGRSFGEGWWPADLHIIGKDIIKFHCAIWPAMLLSAGLPLPKRIFAHGFFTIDGQKISKSLGNAIDPLELVREYPFDAIRYYLLREIPFGSDGDFSHDRLRERYNADLANGLGNLVSRTLTMIEQFVPDVAGNSATSDAVSQALAGFEDDLENVRFDRALAKIWDVIAWGDGMIETFQPWQLAKKGDTEKLNQVLGEVFEGLRAVNEHLAPFLPETHRELTKLLTARPLKKPVEPLFARKD